MSRKLLFRARKTVRRLLNRTGLDIHVYHDDYHYVQNVFGHCARKHIDIRSLPIFGELAREAIDGGLTLLYYDRLYTIFQALRHAHGTSPHSGPVHIAEVGVFKGGTTAFMASVLQKMGTPNPHIHAFDTFEGHAAEDIRSDGAEAHHRAGSFSNTSYEGVAKYLTDYPVTLYKGRVQETADAVSSERFHLVYLDVDIYEPMRFSLDFFARRLVPGGVIIVDDYGFVTCPGTKQAVDEFAEANPQCFPLHLLSGQCVLTINDGIL